MATPHLPRIAPLTASTLLGPTPDPSELVTQSWPMAGNLRSFKKESLQERRDRFRRASEPLVLQKSEEQPLPPSSQFLDLMGLGVPDPDSRRHRLQLPALGSPR